MRLQAFFAVGLSMGAFASLAQAADSEAVFSYQLLQFEGADTFFTGIHNNIITANYVIQGTAYTGGLLYDTDTETWSAFPIDTSNGSNYPGAITSSPYGPSFGSQDGILRAVGSYQTTASESHDLGYLYDAAAAPGEELTTLQYPSTADAQTLFTIAHSTFGNQVIGNYDTRLATGNAFIYEITTGAYTTNNVPGAVSTTAYGIWGDKISGGYFEAAVGGGLGLGHGYIYDQTTGIFTTYDHPGAIATHFEGIVSAGRSGEYNLVTNWVSADGEVHAALMHLAADGTVTWYELEIDGGTVSSNSAYGDQVVGVYTQDGTVYAYIATVEGIYNPISNTGTVTSSTTDDVVLSGRKGDDIVNTGTIRVSGQGGIGMRGETYGVLNNSGTIVATGLGGAAVELHGLYGTLLNSGTLQTSVEADALRTGADAEGTVIVNTGIIDGRIAATAGLDKRFENSGWIGVSGTGESITHLFSGTFVQTSAGTFSLRVVGETGTDVFGITGTARLAGTLEVPFLTSTFQNSYNLLYATQGLTGAFTTLSTTGLPSYVNAALDYSDTAVTLNLTSQMALQAGLSSNQAAVGALVDQTFNAGAGTSATEALGPLYSLASAQLPQALSALSGEAYASEQSVLIGDGLYIRQTMMNRLRQDAYAGQSGPEQALGYGGPALAYVGAGNTGASATQKGPASAALAYATKAPVAASAEPGPVVWLQGFGGSSTLDGDAGSVDETIGGIMAGADGAVGNWRIGAALGYIRSNASMSFVSSSLDADNALAALYAGTHVGPWSVRLGASYAFSQIDASRTIAYPGFAQQTSAQYNAGTAQLFGEVGYGSLKLQAVAFEPFVGLAWVHLNTDGFTENSAGSLATAGLTAASSASDVGYSSLGLRAATLVPLAGEVKLMPHASAAWQYAFGDLSPAAQLAFTSLPDSNFTVGGVPLAQNTALLELGLDLKFNTQTRIGMSYLGQFADSVTVNTVQGAFIWSF